MFLGKLAKIALLGFVGATLIKARRRRHGRETLHGKVVLITGGSRGLGLALAKELAQRGALLALCARDVENLQTAKQALTALGAEVFIHPTDVTDRKQVEVLMHKVHAHYGRIDLLVNNAGAMLVGPQEVMDSDDYKKLMETNCWSSLYCTEAVLPHFKAAANGHIVNIASIGGKIAVPHMLPYSVSKFALVGLSQGLAAELAPAGIQVSTVIPSLMRTGSPMHITVKGNHKLEYAWFKIADSLPILSQSAARAASEIVDGIESRKTEIVLTLTAKIAVALQALCPNVLANTLNLANRLLPRSRNTNEKKGYESESLLSRSALAASTDKAAQQYNQI
ncbi:SDR family NAD(P)-dependent oxidoreductase [Sphingobacterium oryzagri]|uniref:SDR family NAD(P)-dependent oxidoreductase n=1 Tax=Sphingobacterium oryzagri TaxID=3025669 RepID=A0ABY7WD34_9SPHI|nr:SDR family NAD(P)-dependent oxidoreductase [Sphingobacterium sp. KACC 22765]WDF66780.1 SDR family NAD(P)-dependent oxidoreductase [Sphingobacterium sp. KACC 22765]